MGVKAGMPDLHILHNKTFYVIELKADKRKPPAHQQAMLDDLHIAGAKTAVCRSIKEVETFLGVYMDLRGWVA